jgi:hypothetical protein
MEGDGPEKKNNRKGTANPHNINQTHNNATVFAGLSPPKISQ